VKDVIEQVLKVSPAWLISLLLVSIILLLTCLVFYAVLREGRELHLLGLVIGKRTDPPRAAVSTASKVMYVKVIHLKREKAGQKPFYRRTIERLDGETVDVFDEEIYYSVTAFPGNEKHYSYTFRSSGIVDPRTIHPWEEHLSFADKGAQRIKEVVSQLVDTPSNVYIVVSHHYNGLQLGHENVAMRADSDTSYGRLVVDFSSLPNVDSLFMERPKAKLREGNIERSLGIEEFSSAIFSVAHDGMKKDSVLRIEFRIAWEKLPQSST
jgi:hypothetical protein